MQACVCASWRLCLTVESGVPVPEGIDVAAVLVASAFPGMSEQKVACDVDFFVQHVGSLLPSQLRKKTNNTLGQGFRFR